MEVAWWLMDRETRYTFNPGYETYFNAYVPHTRG
jgi:hypothetical protein